MCCLTKWVDPKTVLNYSQTPKYSQLGTKNQKWPQNLVKIKVRIEGNIANKSWSTTWVDPKTVFEPYPAYQKSPFGPQKPKKNQDVGKKKL